MSGVFTPAEHYREASLLLTEDMCSYQCPHTGCAHELASLLRANAHAALATASADVASEAADIDDRAAAARDAYQARAQSGTVTSNGCVFGLSALAPCPDGRQITEVREHPPGSRIQQPYHEDGTACAHPLSLHATLTGGGP